MKIAYALAAATLITGGTVSLINGVPATAQLATEGMSAPALPPGGAPMSFAELTKRLQPAVVNISVRSTVTVGVEQNRITGEQREITQEGGGDGSGFFISADGYIVTNNHVVVGQDGKPATTIIVTLTDGREFNAELVGRDPLSDIAVLKVEGDQFAFVELGDSDGAQVGEWVLAIGNPLGIGSSVTAGIISAVERSAGAGGAYDRLIQTDTAINPGNSGGPLFDLNGRVIGINNRQLSLTRGNIGINFAIPATEARPVINALMKGEEPQRGYLGLGTQPVDPDTAGALDLEKNKGELVRQVVSGAAADKAGIKAGDIVLSVDGKDVNKEQSLAYLVSRIAPGKSVEIALLREGKPTKIRATIGNRPSESAIAANQFNRRSPAKPDVDTPNEGSAERTLYDAFGIGVTQLTPEIAAQLGLPSSTKGVVVTGVTQYGSAARIGLSRGDVIVSVKYNPVTDPNQLADLTNAAKKAGKPGLFLGVLGEGGEIAYGTLRIGS